MFSFIFIEYRFNIIFKRFNGLQYSITNLDLKQFGRKLAHFKTKIVWKKGNKILNNSFIFNNMFVNEKVFQR